MTRRRVILVVLVVLFGVIGGLALFDPTGPSVRKARDIQIGTPKNRAIEILGKPDYEHPRGLRWDLPDGTVVVYFDGDDYATNLPFVTEYGRFEMLWLRIRRRLGI
ncbi:MAG: hypothetical protein ACJ8C4_06445 [Gemmataceae bacterium]